VSIELSTQIGRRFDDAAQKIVKAVKNS